MSDPLRTDAPRAGHEPGAGRDEKIEQLLVLGLDRYFGGDYEEAINVWTRVLFLDRGHTRARAYIERARSAVAERQRESEELLQSGVEAFERREIDAAKRLLTTAVDRGTHLEVALPLLGRLARLSEPERGGGGTREYRGQERPVGALVTEALPSRRIEYLAAAAALVLIGVLLLSSRAGQPSWDLDRLPWRVVSPAGQAVASSVDEAPLPVPRPSEVTLVHAQAERAAGHRVEALRMLESVRPGDPQRPEADRLRATLQRELLGLADMGTPPAAPAISSGVR